MCDKEIIIIIINALYSAHGHKNPENVVLVYELHGFDSNEKKSRHFHKMNELEMKRKQRKEKSMIWISFSELMRDFFFSFSSVVSQISNVFFYFRLGKSMKYELMQM